jgi:hypothetical protein
MARLGRNRLKGANGVAMHAVLCGANYNIRLVINKLRPYFLMSRFVEKWDCSDGMDVSPKGADA